MKNLGLLLAFLCLFGSCKRIELYDYNRLVRLDLCVDMSLEVMPDTSLFSKDADFDYWWQGRMPYHAEVLLYHPQTGKVISSQILPAQGGVLRVPDGDFDLVVYSLGTEWTQMQALSHKKQAEALTSEVTLLYADLFKTVVCNDSAKSNENMDYSYEQDPIVYSPDHVYVSANKQLHLLADLEQEELRLSDTIKTIVQVYSLEVLGVQGLEYVRQVDAFITGQVRSCYFAQPALSSDPATLYVRMKADVEHEKLYTLFGTFGKLPGAENKVYLDIILTDAGGECHRYVYDVTDQFDDENNDHNRLVISDSIVVPPSSFTGGPFDSAIEVWDGDTVKIVI